MKHFLYFEQNLIQFYLKDYKYLLAFTLIYQKYQTSLNLPCIHKLNYYFVCKKKIL